MAIGGQVAREQSLSESIQDPILLFSRPEGRSPRIKLPTCGEELVVLGILQKIFGLEGGALGIIVVGNDRGKIPLRQQHRRR